jgi:hypothetical protein
MKNIHLIATNKPSRLIKNNLGYGICPTGFTASDLDLIQAKFVNINITNDSEIKVGDWFYYKHFGEDIIDKADEDTDLVNLNNRDRFFQKIILTTDQELINDGVQSIDDEFLEWFVNNPSCESVEVEKYHGINTSIAEVNYIAGDGSLSWQGKNDLRDYKIIIPTEEPNPLTVGKEFYESADKNITVYRQETLEEVAEKWVFETNGHKWSNNDDTAGDNFASFIAGAKLQAERMYSEEDLLSAFEAGMMFIGEDKGSFREWFEKFKKK